VPAAPAAAGIGLLPPGAPASAEEVAVSRRRGDRIGQRWELGDELPGTSELRRFRLRDVETGAPMDLWEPRASVLLRPGAAQAWSRAAQAAPTAEAALPRLWVPTDQGMVCVTPAVAGTLDDVRLELGPAQALEIARWLGPAILDPRGTQRDRIRPEDVALDETGVPRLLALGLPPAEAVLEIPHHTAPEVLQRRSPTPASGLYGLGVLLYRALTGAWPVPARSVQDLVARGTTPVRPSALRRDIPPSVDVLVEGLLSTEPGWRLEALRELGPATGPGPVLDLPREPARALSQAPGPLAPLAQPGAQPPARGPGQHLVIAEVHDLAPAARFLVAALAGVAPGVVDAAAGRRQGVVVGALATPGDAQRMTEHLGQMGLRTRTASSLGGGRGALGLLALAAIASAGGAVLVSTAAALTLAAVGFALAVLALLRPAAALRGGPAPRHQEQQEAAAIERRIAGLAIRMVEASLPGPVARDLRDDLHRLSRRIEELCASRADLTRALRAVDHAEAGAPLRRSVAAIDREIDEMADVLDEVEAVLAQRHQDAGPGPSDAVARITERIAALQAARTELEPSPDHDRRRQAAAALRQS